MVLELIQGVAVLLALCMLQSFNLRMWRRHPRVEKISSGLLYGGVCIFGMLVPITLVPGVFFDARSVILSLAGLFGGPLVTLIAASMTALCRIWLGGEGVGIGLAVIAVSSLLGLAYRYLYTQGRLQIGILQLFAFGGIVNAIVVLLLLQLPPVLSHHIFEHVALPYLLTFACATALLGVMLQDLQCLIRAQEALQRSEARLRTIVNAIPDLLFVLDENGCYIEALASESHLLYTESSELLGQRMHDILPQADADHFLQVVQETLQSQSPQRVEYSLETLGGHRYFEGRTHPLPRPVDGQRAVVFLARDITDSRNQHQALIRSSQLLEQAERLARLGAWELDLRSKEVYWSPLTREIHDVAPDYLPDLATALDFYKAGESRDRLVEAVQIAQQTGRSFTMELPLITATGREVWVRTMADVAFEKGQPIRLYGSLQDITETKAKSDALSELAQVTSDQNRRLKQFTYIVSHNIRSHVANLLGLTQILNLPDIDNREQLWDMLCHSIKRLDEVICHLNTVTQIHNQEALPQSPLPLLQAIHTSLSDLRSDISRTGAQIEVVVPPELEVWAVPAYLDSVLLNLLSNALKYAAPDRPPEIHISVEQTPLATVLSIRDNGLGLDLNQVGEKIFGMYQTFHDHPQAQGLGLFLTRAQLEAMGSSIEVVSQPHQGSTFKVFFKQPASAKALLPAPEKPADG